jgi:hypothetical protein
VNVFKFMHNRSEHRRAMARVTDELRHLDEVLGNVQLKEKNQHQRDCLVIGIAVLVMVIIFACGLSEVAR